jgi:hypothetical protein
MVSDSSVRLFATFFVLGISHVEWTVAEESFPSILVAIITRNAENTLPFVLGGLENQDYPADRLHIWYVD